MNHPLAALFEQFLKERTFLRNVASATFIWYQVAFKNYCRTLTGDSSDLPTKSSLQHFVITLRERGVRPVTVDTYIAAMNAFCRWLHEEKHLAEPLRLSKLRVEHRVLALLNDSQLRTLLAFKPKAFRQARTHLAVAVVLDCGLRVSELLNLKRTEVDLDNLLLKTFGKGRKERLVSFSPELRKRLYRFEQVKAKKNVRSEFVFAGFGGAKWAKRNSSTSLYLLQDKMGLERFGWHRLRHTFATNYLRQGGDMVRRR